MATTNEPTSTAYADFATADGTPVMHPCGRTGVITGRNDCDGYRTVQVTYDVPQREWGAEYPYGYAPVGTARILAPGEVRQATKAEALLGELDAIAARMKVCGPGLSHEHLSAAADYMADRCGDSPIFRGREEARRWYMNSSSWDLLNGYRFARSTATATPEPAEEA